MDSRMVLGVLAVKAGRLTKSVGQAASREIVGDSPYFEIEILLLRIGNDP